MACKHTSKKATSSAYKILRDGRTSNDSKSASSALTQNHRSAKANKQKG